MAKEKTVEEVQIPATENLVPWSPPADTRGIEHITKDDVQMPRMALAQGLSPQIQEGDPTYVEGLKVGQMFNSLTSEIYGKGPIHFTIIRADRPRFVEFIPRNEGGGVRDFNVPANDPRTQFTTSEDGTRKKPVATKFYDFVIMLLPSGELMALSFKSSMLKVARQLNMLMVKRQKASFAGRYELSAIMTKNAQGPFAAYVVKNAGEVDQETYMFAEKQYEAFKDKVLDIHREGDEVPEGTGDVDGSTDFDTSKM